MPWMRESSSLQADIVNGERERERERGIKEVISLYIDRYVYLCVSLFLSSEAVARTEKKLRRYRERVSRESRGSLGCLYRKSERVSSIFRERGGEMCEYFEREREFR